MRDPRLIPFRLPMLAFAVMVGVQALSGAVLFVRKIGLRPSTVQAFYLGSEQAFTRPRTLEGLLEVAVPHLLAVPMVLLITIHLVAFASAVRRDTLARMGVSAFVVALIGIALGFGVRFVSPGLAWLKIACFLATEAMLLFWLALLVSLFRSPPDATQEPSSGPEGAGG